ncbi:MAG: hypothetical protein AAF449_16200, partial [Myxococcota bacterium]
MSFPIKPEAVVIDQGRSRAADRWTALHPVARRVEDGITTLRNQANARRDPQKTPPIDSETLASLEHDAKNLMLRMRRLSQRDKGGLSRFLSRYPELSAALEDGARLKKSGEPGLIVSHQLGIPNAKGWA